MEIEKIKTPNSRLLFKESLDAGKDWFTISEEVKSFIEDHGQLQLANADTLIYFFSPSADEFFSEENIWVGREVIGNAQLQQEDFDLSDLGAGFCYSHMISLTPEKTWDDLFNTEKSLREHSDLNFAESWRIRVPYPGDLRCAKIELFELEDEI